MILYNQVMAQKTQRQAFSLINFTCHGERKRKIEYSTATSQAVWQKNLGRYGFGQSIVVSPISSRGTNFKAQLPYTMGASKLIQLPCPELTSKLKLTSGSLIRLTRGSLMKPFGL